MKKYYLVYEQVIFIDPHGDTDNGQLTKTVEFTDKYNYLDLSLTYNMDLEEIDEECEFEGSEDGYNSTETLINIKEITSEEAKAYSKIIIDYNSI